MSSIETNQARELAGAIFDRILLPLAQARNTVGRQSYFATAPEVDAVSYYQEPLTRVMQPADFQFPGGGSAEGLVDALAAFWAAEGEASLASMAPELKRIAEALRLEAAQGDGTVSVLCYTMF